RDAQGLLSYTLQGQLAAAAQGHSTDMACNGFFSHTGSDGSNVGQRVNAQGYSWSWVGENIFATSDTSSQAPQSAFTWWMNSSAHRANLLSPNYTEIGLGYIYVAGSPYGGYFTAVFARP
ncbi:MAG: CAP domain-containing protein, partial [Chloroflexota bacterium]